ncbi:hypothetical protein SDJN02_06613, partial [Cucurbita argyrosperma subsp. argyrosperma]
MGLSWYEDHVGSKDAKFLDFPIAQKIIWASKIVDFWTLQVNPGKYRSQKRHIYATALAAVNQADQWNGSDLQVQGKYHRLRST